MSHHIKGSAVRGVAVAPTADAGAGRGCPPPHPTPRTPGRLVAVLLAERQGLLKAPSEERLRNFRALVALHEAHPGHGFPQVAPNPKGADERPFDWRAVRDGGIAMRSPALVVAEAAP